MIDIKKICKEITDNLQSLTRKPAQYLPQMIMICSLMKRPGLSCIASTANIISSIGKKGMPTQAEFEDGTPNFMNKMVNSVVCEVFRAIQQDMNIQVVIPPGSITSIGQGGGPSGPIMVTSTNLAAKGQAAAL